MKHRGTERRIKRRDTERKGRLAAHFALLEILDGSIVRPLDIVREKARGKLARLPVIVQAFAAGEFLRAGVSAVAVFRVDLPVRTFLG
jgi:hypothetical protein